MKTIIKVRIVHRLQMGLLVRFSSDCIPIRIAFDIVSYKTGEDADFTEQIRMVAYRPGRLYRPMDKPAIPRFPYNRQTDIFSLPSE